MHHLHPNPHTQTCTSRPRPWQTPVLAWLEEQRRQSTFQFQLYPILPPSSPMAPALTSNSFRLASSLGAKPNAKFSKPLAIIYAKQVPSGIGKRKDGSSEDGNQGEGATKRKPFFVDIDFGKLVPEGKSLIPVVSSPSTSLFASSRRKDPRTVFVSGATGQAGVRIALTLLRQGYTVRAGVPELASAQELARLAATYKMISPEESRRLNAVESTFRDAESIAKAIGPAAKVVVTVGPTENGPSAAVTTDDALQVVRAAQLAGVGHMAVVYDSGSSISVSSTYNVLDGINSFFSNIFSRSQPLTLGEFLSKVVETDVAYTLIKANLTDDYATNSSHGLVVTKEGSATPGATNKYKVPRSKIATVVADVLSNTSVAENKVVEVCTSPLATSKPMVELFSAIPEDGRRKEYAEAIAKAKAEEEALLASEKAREAAEAAKKLKEEVKKLSEQEVRATSLVEEARERAEAAGSSLESILNKAKDFGVGFSWEKISSQISTAAVQNSNDKPKTQLATVRGQDKARKLPPQRAVIKQPASKPKAKEEAGQKPEVRKVFGGLFKQETIYIDED